MTPTAPNPGSRAVSTFPTIVGITEVIPVLVTVLCLVLVIWSAPLVYPAGVR
jgi:hypothetical protein